MADIKFDTIVGGPIGTNCYLVYNDATKEAVIIDPGVEFDSIKAGVARLGLKPVAILLTHGHIDHTLYAAQTADYYGIEIYIHEEDKELAMDGQMNCSAPMFGMSLGVDAKVTVKDQIELDMIGTKIKVLHTPGHTKGGCCYYIDEASYVFCGDTLFLDSVGRTDFPTGNPRILVDSLNNVLFKLPDDVKAFPGHGPATSIGYEKRNNPYARGYLI